MAALSPSPNVGAAGARQRDQAQSHRTSSPRWIVARRRSIADRLRGRAPAGRRLRRRGGRRCDRQRPESPGRSTRTRRDRHTAPTTSRAYASPWPPRPAAHLGCSGEWQSPVAGAAVNPVSGEAGFWGSGPAAERGGRRGCLREATRAGFGPGRSRPLPCRHRLRVSAHPSGPGRPARVSRRSCPGRATSAIGSAAPRPVPDRRGSLDAYHERAVSTRGLPAGRLLFVTEAGGTATGPAGRSAHGDMQLDRGRRQAAMRDPACRNAVPRQGRTGSRGPPGIEVNLQTLDRRDQSLGIRHNGSPRAHKARRRRVHVTPPGTRAGGMHGSGHATLTRGRTEMGGNGWDASCARSMTSLDGLRSSELNTPSRCRARRR